MTYSSIRHCILLFTIALTASFAAAASEPFVLVRNVKLELGPPETILVLRNGADFMERSAANEFVEYVQRATANNTLIPQAYGSVPEGWNDSAIILGVAGQSPFKDVDPATMKMHGFRIRTEPKRLIIIGATEQGAANALYWLLSEKIGVRWYMPTRLGEEVPVHQGITFDAMDVNLAPDIPMVAAGAMTDARFYNTSLNLTPQGVSRETMTRHIWDEILIPSDANRHDHPEWFALTDRKELPKQEWMLKYLWMDAQGHIRSNQVCTTDPGVLNLFASHITRFFRANPNVRMYTVEPNDYADFCTCARCKALDKELGDGPLSNRLVYFFNQVAAEVKKEFPDRRLGFYAYAGHVLPPTTVKADPMLWAPLCFFGSPACYQHAIDDPNCPINKQWKESVFDGWSTKLNGLGFYSYYAYSGSWMGPQLLTRHLAQDLRLMHSHGCTYFHVDGYLNWSTNAPMLYLIRRLPWDVNADPVAILDEWYRGTYGPAYEPMKKYWETLTEGRFQVQHEGSNPSHPEKMFTREIIARAWEQLKLAEQVVGSADERFRRRVAIARTGLEFTDPMALAYGLVAEGKWNEGIASGKKALAAIVAGRSAQPEAFSRPGYPREAIEWVWYRNWDGSLSAESLTQGIISDWETQAKQSSDAVEQYGDRLVELPEMWQFRKDESDVGRSEKWFDAAVPSESWRTISTHIAWTSQPFPGEWHGIGWYRIDVPLKAPPQGKLTLCFGAIDGWATVWVNGVEVGRHTKAPEIMWNKPFRVDITDAARRDGINRIAVRVMKQDQAAGMYTPTEIRIAKP